ncbi:hypothetical protein LCGC14_0044710 [marine sediment metagenome]|uniref:Uncharacterized protein n=2 Tax=root TaxID=1 RepID=A0A7V1BJ55_9RHOB|nr:hypothetical protein [Sulfitobacter litoralis]HDZ53515.1 hypothetical protein [Sulfitobacter litoralis]
MSGKLTAEEASRRLLGLARGIAHQAETEPGLTRSQRCEKTAYGLLALLDGKTPKFPRCMLAPQQHEEDIAEAKAEGMPWYNEDIFCSPGLSDHFLSRLKDPSWLPERTDAAPYTADEIRDQIVRSFMGSAEYWAKNNKTDELKNCDGVAFSCFGALDGVSLSGQMMSIILDAEDIAQRHELREFQPEVLQPYLHELYHSTDPIEIEIPTPGALNLYSVSVPNSMESSDWYVVARDATHAAEIYTQGVIDEKISVDAWEMDGARSLTVQWVGKNATGEPRWIDWGSTNTITMRLTPYEVDLVALADLANWNDFQKEQGLEP